MWPMSMFEIVDRPPLQLPKYFWWVVACVAITTVGIGIYAAHEAEKMPDWWYDWWKKGYHDFKEGNEYDKDGPGTFEEQDAYDKGREDAGGKVPSEDDAASGRS